MRTCARIEAVLSDTRTARSWWVDANGRFDLETARRLREGAARVSDLFWYEEPGDPLDFELQATLRRVLLRKPMATGEDLFSMQDARNLIRYGGMRPDRDWLQFDCALSYGLGRVSSHARHAAPARLVTVPLHSPRRTPDVPQHCSWAGVRRQRSIPGSFSAVRRFPGRCTRSRKVTSRCPICRAGIGFEGKSDSVLRDEGPRCVTPDVGYASATSSLTVRLPKSSQDHKIGR